MTLGVLERAVAIDEFYNGFCPIKGKAMGKVEYLCPILHRTRVRFGLSRTFTKQVPLRDRTDW